MKRVCMRQCDGVTVTAIANMSVVDWEKQDMHGRKERYRELVDGLQPVKNKSHNIVKERYREDGT